MYMYIVLYLISFDLPCMHCYNNASMYLYMYIPVEKSIIELLILLFLAGDQSGEWTVISGLLVLLVTCVE